MSTQQLNSEETAQMLKLEQLFHNRYLNPEFLHQLIAIYVKAIEQFNNEYKFMRTYFMDKMQFVLSSPQIVTMLEGGGNITDSIRETVRMTERPAMDYGFVQKEQYEPTSKNATKERERQKKNQSEDRFKKKQQNDVHIKHTHEEHHYYHYDENKNNQKGLKIDMKMKVMREVEQNLKNIHKEVNQADKKLIMAEEKVKDITKTQEELLNQRLAKRKKKLRKKSMEIKAQVIKIDSEEPQREPEPIIQKEELKQAQRQLTQAIFKFTIRMTQKQREKESNEGKNVKGRVKKAKDLDQDEILLEQQQEHESDKPEANMKKPQQNTKGEQASRGRIKTIRRHLDSDDDA